MRTTVELRDMLTTLQVRPDAMPGLDGGVYKQVNVEEDAFQFWEIRNIEHAAAASVGDETISRWPPGLSSAAWVDLDSRYNGLPVELWQMDGIIGAGAPIPAGELLVDKGHGLDERDAPVTRLNTWRETQIQQANPSEWIRLDLDNERRQQLSQPLLLQWRTVRGQSLRLVIPDNDVLTPLDCTHPERYSIKGPDGSQAPASVLDLVPGARNVVYVKPRRWRWLARTIAHFMFITLAEQVQNDETFIYAWHDRPPFWPYRHDVMNSAGRHDLAWYDGTMTAYDGGIDAAWNASRASATLRHQIVEQQYFTLCVSYVLINVEDALLTIYREAPKASEPVAVIERGDPVSGTTERYVVTALADQDDLYPRTVIGLFYGSFYV